MMYPQENFTITCILGNKMMYPPMPKSDPAKKGRMPVPEEEMSSGEEMMMSPVAPSKRITVRKKPSEGTAEWEKVRFRGGFLLDREETCFCWGTGTSLFQK